MVATKELLISQALTLSEADRIDVIERLSESLNSTSHVTEAWDNEIDKRLDKVAAGRGKFIPWQDARRQIAGDLDASQS